MNVNLIWATPDADALMGRIARVSNPANQDNPEVGGLLRYCARHGHWSVFEHAHACLEINTTRDIGRQIIRHRSFAFSEFSQRYQDVAKLGDWQYREARMQDAKNRQNSLEVEDEELQDWWADLQQEVTDLVEPLYSLALRKGIAKEQARALLPEGLTPSRLYMTGSMRSWITYLQVRTDLSTQKEHRLIAEQVLETLRPAAPITVGAFFPEAV